jgi:AraC-like DNA-binding protein
MPQFNFNRYSALLLVFFIHGLVYAILLFRKGSQNERNSDKWLGFFLILCILYICPWMLGYAGWYNGKECMDCRNFMFYMPLQHTLLMGPAIYFYVLNLLNPAFRFQKKDSWHFLPAVLYLCWNVVVAVTDNLILHKYYLMDGENDPDFQAWYVVAGIISLLYYLLLCIRYYNNYRKFIVQEFSFADSVTFMWVRNFLIACLIYFLSTLVFYLLELFGMAGDTRGAWWYYLVFAIIFYYIAITGYSNSIENRVSFRLDFLRYRLPGLLGSSVDEAMVTEDIMYEEVSGHTGISETSQPDFTAWKEKVLDTMENQNRYRDADLTLTDLAKELNTHASLLSKVINQSFGMNFNDFINQYRVNEVKNRLQNPAFSHLTIMSIAYESGFNSKATFNRAFKKLTGKNPKDFIIR